MSAITARRSIDNRFVPPVKGIDLEQSLNYIDLNAAGVDFVYDHYTTRRLFYIPGSRPRLEAVVTPIIAGSSGAFETTQRLAHWVSTNVRWAGFHKRDQGSRLAVDSASSEEQLLDRGYGWCNEQARLFCALCQIAGIPSRIVFAFNKARRYGHVISEVLLPDGRWMAVDQSLGFCFATDHRPVRAADIYHDPITRNYFSPIYIQLCQQLIDQLGHELIKHDFTMAASDNPLDGFVGLGFHNYYVH